MSKLTIKLDSYKKFFYSEHGLKLITEIIESDDYDAIKKIAKWDQCPSKVLDKIAIKYMVERNHAETERNLEILECVVENSKISVKTLEQVMYFASRYLKTHKRYAYDVLEEIAESKKLTTDIARWLYSKASEYALYDVVEELAENENTPDEILYEILGEYDNNTSVYENACEEIIKRYKKLREQLAKKQDE